MATGVVIQEVVRLPDIAQKQFGPLPLAGRRILITRARSQASALAEALRALGGEPVEFPLIAIAPPESWAPLDAAVAGLASYRWVVVTSGNGVEALGGRLRAAGGDPARLPPGLRVAAVGAATAQALEMLGMRVDLVPPEFRGAALPGALAPLLAPGDRILMPRGDLADPALADRLRALGAQVDDLVAYRTVAGEGEAAQLLADLAGGTIDYVSLTSSSTVAGLLERLGGPGPLAGVRIACIGPETARTATAAGLTVHVLAPEATVVSLAAAIAQDAESLRRHV